MWYVISCLTSRSQIAVFFTLYKYPLCWKIKRMHLHWSWGQNEASAFKAHLPADAISHQAGVVLWFYSTQTGFLSDGLELMICFRSTAGNS